MNKYKDLLRIYCLLYIVHKIESVCPHDPNTPVVDLCGTDPFTAYAFFVQSAGMEQGYSKCKCVISSDMDDSNVDIRSVSNVTAETCDDYVFIIQGLPNKLTYAWCHKQGTLRAVINAEEKWSIDVAKTSNSSLNIDPGHCILVDGFKPITISCNHHNSSTPITRPPPPVKGTTEGPTATVNHIDTIIIGVCIGAVVLLLIVAIIIWRQCIGINDSKQKTELYGDIPVIRVNGNKSSTANGTSRIESPRVIYLEPLPSTSINRSNSNPDAWRQRGKQQPVYVNLLRTTDGSYFKENSKEFRKHQLDYFREVLANTATIESGGTIEAKHRYITQITKASPDGLQYPVSRASSLGKQTRKSEERRKRHRSRSGDRKSTVGRSRSLNSPLGAL